MFLFKIGRVCVMFVGATTVAMLVVAVILILMVIGGAQ